VNLKQELPIENHSRAGDIFTKDWQKKNKSFRYKKRFSFLTQDKIWRIDITAIKQTKDNEYFKTFKQAQVLSQPERFELEIEYVGNTDSRSPFSPPPITQYSNLLKEVDQSKVNAVSPLGYVYNQLDSVTLDEETTDLSLNDPNSPRYDEGIEFDEALYPLDSPRPLPDTITIKSSYWKDTNQEFIWNHIKKGHEPDEWVHETYKFIPRKKLYKGKKLSVQVELSPHTQIVVEKNKGTKTEDIKGFLVPIEYIVEDIESILETDESDKTIDSPHSSFSLIDSSVYTKTVIQLFKDLNNILIQCFQIIHETHHILGKSDGIDVMKKYCKLTDQKYKAWWTFMAPQPVSMALEHLNPYNPNAIMSKYAVTEKADGIRAQLLITNNRGFLLTPRHQVIDAGVSFGETTDDWIFDGEYITQKKRGEPIRLLMIFDVYYSSQASTQPHTYPWYSKKGTSRSIIIKEFKQTVSITQDTGESVRIGFKQYYEGPDKLVEKSGKFKNLSTILKYSKKILDKEEKLGGFEYFTDGLIFLPMFLPVKGTTEGESVKSIKGTWNLNYKWKPPEENTIDFKVIYMKERGRNITHTYNHVGEDGKKGIQSYQKVQVVVEYKEKDDMNIDYNWALLTNKPANKHNYQYFDPPDYKVDNIHITNIPLLNNKMICKKDKRYVQNGSIVEMSYNPEAKNGYHWIPLRIRDDKGGKFQYFKTANSIWKTINNPVTPSMIKGVVDFENLSTVVPESQQYYVDTTITEDTPIRDLHNYIKSKLIARIGSSPDHKGKLMIVDLSCGRGGDIKKYLSLKNDIAFILGLDIASNVNEAAQRYYYISNPKPKAVFLQFDTSQSIIEKQGCLGNTEICESMIDMIFSKSKTFPKKYKQIQKDYSGIAKQGFDIVSSQFSVHYYFKDEETLRGFCENVRDLCSSGGFFIGTCYDGLKVFEAFTQAQKDTIEMKDEFGSLIYQVKKLYDTPVFTYEQGNMDDMLGKEIEVFMASIGQPFVEYLVNFEFFIDIMKEYGFEPALPTFRKGEYNPIKEPIQDFDKLIASLDDIRENDNEFIKKTRNTAMFKVGTSKGYSLLSGLNKSFVFRKK